MRKLGLITLFLYLMISFYGHSEECRSKVSFRLETSGLNNFIVKGNLKGDLSDLEGINDLTLLFHGARHSSGNCSDSSYAPRDFKFQGEGGFFSTTNLSKSVKESIESSFSDTSIPYLNNGFTSNQQNIAVVIGNLKNSDSFFFVFFGEITPSRKIETGEFRLTLKGRRDPGQEELIIAKGKVKISIE